VVQLNNHCVADRQEDELPYWELISRQVSQHGAIGPGVCWLNYLSRTSCPLPGRLQHLL